MEELIMQKNDELVMKLLHFFITEHGYSPIVLKGAKNEIWLENLNSEYKIVRIASNYIHNNEQLEYDFFRTKQIIKKIKKKTFSFNMHALVLFINIGENVDFPKYIHKEELDSADIKNITDLKKYDFITSEYPNITKKTNFKEKGAELFSKITKEITSTSERTSLEAEEIFKSKKPYATVSLVIINMVVFLLMYLFGNGSTNVGTLLNFGANYGPLVRNGEYFRLITAAFLHAGLLHLLFNCYALYIVGAQIESFLGKTKFLLIYFFSALAASLMSMLFYDGLSVGASGAIFGLFGALLYFGYHYRVYLGNVLKSQIIPLILINLLFGFVVSGVDNAAHIGGLIGGLLMTMTVGIKYKSDSFEKINGLILSIMYILFLTIIGFNII